jgi:hypothetical protein
MILGTKSWGPKAWYFLHIFSIKKISKKKIHNYYLFYTTFTYLIPCIICSEHYANIIYVDNILEEKNINQEYLKKWVFDTHNLVNKLLNKTILDYNDFNNDLNINYKNINHNNIFFIIKNFFFNIDYDNISLYKFDQINTFFINFCLLYPKKNIRILLKKMINSEDFCNIKTPKEFNFWFINNIFFIKKIIFNL